MTQEELEKKIRRFVAFANSEFGMSLDSDWVVAIARVESSLGVNQKSKTGALGVFQMTTIAMKDLLQAMEFKDSEFIDIANGIAFLSLLLNRHKTIEAATMKYCDPKDREFYYKRVSDEMKKMGR